MTTAYWCVLVAAFMPYLCVGIAKSRSRYNNNTPRDSSMYKGIAQRASGAHHNSFEIFPFFAVAVIVASGGSAHTANHLLDQLALAWVISRLAYVAAYLLDHASVRSLIWMVGIGLTLAIFTMPVWHG